MVSINGVLRRRLGYLKMKPRLVSNVPKECFPVYVGENKKRFVIPLKYLSSPIFQSILDQSAEDLGGKFEGPIVLTCNVKVFKEALKRVRSLENKKKMTVIGMKSTATTTSSGICILNSLMRWRGVY